MILILLAVIIIAIIIISVSKNMTTKPNTIIQTFGKLIGMILTCVGAIILFSEFFPWALLGEPFSKRTAVDAITPLFVGIMFLLLFFK